MWTDEEETQLLDTAKASIKNGLSTGLPLIPEKNASMTALQVIRASFVTLTLDQHLRGCIGSLDARRPLIEDVAANAFSSAFKDSRFEPLTADELEKVSIGISVLTPIEPMNVKDEQDLLSQLQPGIDGLLIDDGYHRATFLPQVWSELSEPVLFLNQLKRKAGLAQNSWSKTMKCFRYHCDKLGES